MLRIWTILLVVLVSASCQKQENLQKPISESVPEWAKQAVLYELFVRDFTPEGTFKSIQQKIPYLKKLGVDIVWLMPIYPIGEKGRKGTLGSPYSVRNYYEVNPEFGTKEDFRDLVETIHKAGMKVIIGFVPNHSANDYVEMAAHPDWFMRDEKGNFTREVAEWSDITDFNYDNPQLRQHIIDILKYWLSEFDVDGFRFDVAGMVPDDFWRQAVPEMRKVKSDIFLLAEWEDKKFIDFGFSADYSWSVLHTLKDVYKGKKTVSQLVQAYENKLANYSPDGMFINFVENHDEPRAVLVFGKQHFKPFAAFTFTVPGMPLLFMGQEFADTDYSSWRSLFEKEPIDWADFDSTTYRFYKTLVDLRHSFPLNFSQWQVLHISDETKTLAYAVHNSDGCLIAVLNFNAAGQRINFSLPETLSPFTGKEAKEIFSGEKIKLSKEFEVELQPYDVKVFLISAASD